MLKKKSILVTGSHRSGSTWTGRMLSISKKIKYVHEPFNLNHRSEFVPVKYWFEYVTESDNKVRQNRFLNYLKGIIGFPIRIPGTGLTNITANDRSFLRFLVKDPNAIFSADWIAKKLDMDVVVLIRHPAAFVGSLKVMKWFHDFNHFLNQETLMSQVLFPFEKEIRTLVKKENDIIEHGILLWNLIHYRIRHYQNRFNNWHFIRHEDLSLNPIEVFGKLYKSLQIDYSEEIKNEILIYTQGKEISELKRNSKKNIFSWRSRLTDDEILKIRSQTEEYSHTFYSHEDW
ncbi:sulfotransferase [Fulvivirgaceae bacterium BMA12]|uniref:Sulfotransferase n=1 Tax=Agaribacillus aureus TaxID=3051825 RepID=A0ABT8LBD0_9BACT|nr:sulfotransferase [Fulvivirgaceae bacterium BMA12]